MVASSRALASGTRRCFRSASASAAGRRLAAAGPRGSSAAAAAASASAAAPPFAAAAASDAAPIAVPMPAPPAPGEVRVRFAPSPTGNLHVGGARTALFNWLYAKKMGGKFILRIEDTDAARSTRESEEAMKSDLRWLGLVWDEGPDDADAATSPHAPYRQSERAPLYQALVARLVAEKKAYPCFCTDAELEAMKADAEAQKLAPIYRGKWAHASEAEVAEEKAKGTPCCYRFRVPPGAEVAIDDAVRGRVAWSTDTLGDFVVLRSNGLPVYNFCVAVDDALMRVTDVLRAEEHLPNTLRQVLVYEALGFPVPRFAHMSLILAPDRSKLSKRHGATSVGEFRAQGYLPQAMVNYLALLGWNDGSEQEVFSARELCDKFSVSRITKSPAVFDRAKLGWMNGQHLRALPAGEVSALLVGALKGGEGSAGEQEAVLAASADAAFCSAAAALVAGSVDVLTEAAPQVRAILDYPLERTASDAEDKAFAAVRADAFGEVVAAVLAAAESGELEAVARAAAAPGGDGAAFKAWAKAVGKATGRKGKRLFMPLRVALTGRTQGPDVGEVLGMLARCDAGRDLRGGVAFSPLGDRVAALRAWAAAAGQDLGGGGGGGGGGAPAAAA